MGDEIGFGILGGFSVRHVEGASDQRCTCPPMVDVMRGRAGGTRYPCPIHPEPDLSGLTFLPAMDFSKVKINTEPLAFESEADDA